MGNNPLFTKPRDEMSFGQMAAGCDFNPSGDEDVQACKDAFAQLIDQMHDLRTKAGTGEQSRHALIAITHMEDAQMRAVKALTWRG